MVHLHPNGLWPSNLPKMGYNLGHTPPVVVPQFTVSDFSLGIVGVLVQSTFSCTVFTLVDSSTPGMNERSYPQPIVGTELVLTLPLAMAPNLPQMQRLEDISPSPPNYGGFGSFSFGKPRLAFLSTGF